MIWPNRKYKTYRGTTLDCIIWSLVDTHKSAASGFWFDTIECDTWSRVEPHLTATRSYEFTCKVLQSNVVEPKCCTFMCVNQWPNDTVLRGTPFKGPLHCGTLYRHDEFKDDFFKLYHRDEIKSFGDNNKALSSLQIHNGKWIIACRLQATAL